MKRNNNSIDIKRILLIFVTPYLILYYLSSFISYKNQFVIETIIITVSIIIGIILTRIIFNKK